MNCYLQTGMGSWILRALLPLALLSPSQVVIEEGQAPSSALPCLIVADDETLLTESERNQLCFGARTEGPALCYIDARDRTLLTVSEAMGLCRCATSTRPVDCYVEGDARVELLKSEVLELCNPIVVNRLFFDCTPRVATLVVP